MDKIIGFIKKNVVTILSILVAVVGVVLFLVWSLNTKDVPIGGAVSSALSLSLFLLGIIFAIPKALNFFAGSNTISPAMELGERSRKRARLHPFIKIFLFALLGRIILLVTGYIIYCIVSENAGTFFETLEKIWVKGDTDAPHYFSIAENLYPTTYPQKYTLVFLPLFPMVIRVFNLIFNDSFVSAFIINTICSCLAAPVIYELALCDMGRRSSRFAVFCAFALPAAIFYAAPMSEALFLLLSASTLLALRKEKLWLAAIFGALSAFTRSLGAVLIVPFAAEAVAICVRYYKENGKNGLAKRIITASLCTVSVLIGTFVYLLINKLIWGEWFKFMDFQKEIWSQELGLFFGTVSTQTDMLVRTVQTADIEASLGLWLPNLLYIFGALAVFVASARRMRTSYAMYYAAYFFVSIGATWLLSAPRYLTEMVVLPIALAQLCRCEDSGKNISFGRKKMWIVGGILIVGQLLYLIMYINRYRIY